MNSKTIGFPDPETNPDHGVWTWDGEKWVTSGSGGSGGGASYDDTQIKADLATETQARADGDTGLQDQIDDLSDGDIDLPEMTSDATKDTLVLRDGNANAKFNLVTCKNITFNQPTVSHNTADIWFLSGGETSSHGVKKNDALGMRSSLSVYSKVEIDAMTIGGGGGDGAVTSVNDQTGAVNLTASDVGAQVVGDYAVSDHTHSQYQAKGDYAASSHTHSQYQAKGDYAVSGHTHSQYQAKGDYAADDHTHDYATSNHTHSQYQAKGDYATSNHTHSQYQAKGDYAAEDHNHTGVYEPVIGTKKTAFNVNFGTANGDAARGNHTHSYASASHNHTGVYEPVIGTKKTAFNVNLGTGSGDAAKGNHTHSGYSSSTHNHTGVYEPVIGTKKSAFNVNLGTGSGDAAKGNHTHSGYAASSHTHDYAASSHTHNYAASNHTHDYATSNHTHSQYQAKGDYATSGHTHSGYVNTSGTQTIGGSKTFSSSVFGPDFIATSDERRKDNITPMPVGLIDAIKPVSWEWKDGSGPSAGVVAQQLQEVGLGDYVHKNEDGGLGVNYQALTSILLAEVIDLKSTVEGLK